jgi:hypothetical protein
MVVGVGAVVAAVSGGVDSGIEVGLVLCADDSASSPLSDDPHADTTSANAIAHLIVLPVMVGMVDRERRSVECLG